MRDDVIEEFEYVLLNLERAVVRAYAEDPSLLDLDVLDAFDTLIRRYACEAEGRTPPRMTLGPKASACRALIESICEWQLGRNPFAGENGEEVSPPPIDISDLVDCLKQLRKSARFWNKQSGRQGYLDYVSSFLGGR